MGKIDSFPQGAPQVKIGYFCKMLKILYNSAMRAVTIFYKKGTKLLKTFSAKIAHAASSGTSPGTPLHFCLLPRIIDVKQQKNKSQFVKNELHSPTCLPRKKMGIFAKMTKIVHSINIRTVSLFYKKGVKI